MNFRSNHRMNFGARRPAPDYISWLAVLLLTAFIVGMLSACAGAVPKSDLERAEYARGALNGVYDSIKILKQQGAISAERRDNLVAAADGFDTVIKQIESGSSSTASCLAVLNTSLQQAGQPAIVTAASCLDALTQGLLLLRNALGSKQSWLTNHNHRPLPQLTMYSLASRYSRRSLLI